MNMDTELDLVSIRDVDVAWTSTKCTYMPAKPGTAELEPCHGAPDKHQMTFGGSSSWVAQVSDKVLGCKLLWLAQTMRDDGVPHRIVHDLLMQVREYRKAFGREYDFTDFA